MRTTPRSLVYGRSVLGVGCNAWGMGLLVTTLFLGACQRDLVLIRPGSPVLITAAHGTVTLSAWDSDEGRLVELGEVNAASLVGLTASDFDWSEASR